MVYTALLNLSLGRWEYNIKLLVVKNKFQVLLVLN